MVDPSAGTPDRNSLGVAVGAQFVALVVSTVVAVAFLLRPVPGGSGQELKPGVVPIVVSLLPLWACLLGGVLIAARGRGERVAALVGLSVRLSDPLWIVVGIVLQYVGALLYLPFSIDHDRLEKPARELVDRAGSIGVGFAVLAVTLVVLAPAVEELFYRGLVLGAIRRVFEQRSTPAAAPIAVVLGGIWFAGVHFEWLQFPALLLSKYGRALTVVVSPLQALMEDQVRSLVDRGIKATYLASPMGSTASRSFESGRPAQGITIDQPSTQRIR